MELFCVFMFLISSILAKNKFRLPQLKYPKRSPFWATDFFVKGCKNFLLNCPQSYKYQLVCAQSFDGDFKDFANYCEMQFENCNSWRNWHIFKRERC